MLRWNDRRLPIWPLAAMLMITSVAQAEDEASPPAPRPKFQMPRQNEDWSALKDRDAVEIHDPLKYISIDESNEVWLSVGGQARVRAETWSNFNFGARPPGADEDDLFVLDRLLLHADLHVGEDFRLFVEGKHASTLLDRDLAGGGRTLDVDNLGLLQAFVDYRPNTGKDLTLRGGRQILKFGRERLVSPLPWGNTLRSWDGVSAILKEGPWKITGFWTAYAPVQKHEFNDGDLDTQFGGVYAEGKWDDGQQWDLYALYSTFDNPVFNGTAAGSEERLTLGTRLFHREGDLDGEVETAIQVGEVGRQDVLATMLALQAGYTLSEVEGTPRVSIGLDHASGDNRAGGKVQTFNQLYPLGHAYLGTMDYIGRQNNIDLSLGLGLKPSPTSKVQFDLHSFWLEDDDDAIYNPGGGVLRAPTAGSARHIGYEFDLNVKHVFRPGLVGGAGYGHFFAGSALRNSGRSKDSDFLYAQMQLTF